MLSTKKPPKKLTYKKVIFLKITKITPLKFSFCFMKMFEVMLHIFATNANSGITVTISWLLAK